MGRFRCVEGVLVALGSVGGVVCLCEVDVPEALLNVQALPVVEADDLGRVPGDFSQEHVLETAGVLVFETQKVRVWRPDKDGSTA